MDGAIQKQFFKTECLINNLLKRIMVLEQILVDKVPGLGEKIKINEDTSTPPPVDYADPKEAVNPWEPKGKEQAKPTESAPELIKPAQKPILKKDSEEIKRLRLRRQEQELIGRVRTVKFMEKNVFSAQSTSKMLITPLLRLSEPPQTQETSEPVTVEHKLAQEQPELVQTEPSKEEENTSPAQDKPTTLIEQSMNETSKSEEESRSDQAQKAIKTPESTPKAKRAVFKSNNTRNMGGPDRDTIDIIIDLGNKHTIEFKLPREARAVDLIERAKKELKMDKRDALELTYIQHRTIKPTVARLWDLGMRHFPNHVAYLDEKVEIGDQVRWAFLGVGPNVNYKSEPSTSQQ